MTMMSNSTRQNNTGTKDAAGTVDLDALMQANVIRIFNERNSSLRLAALRELYTEDATLYDPETAATGQQAISEAVDSLHRMLPADFVFTATGHAVGHNGVGRLFWRAGPPNGPAAVTGIDVAHIENGRIKFLYVFVDPAAR
jgi:SnoaL-like domain